MRLRRLSWILLPLAPSFSVACFDTSVDDLAFAPDAGADDAATPIADATVPDAGTAPIEAAAPTEASVVVDAGPDVIEEPAAPPPVSVLVRGATSPESGTKIVFSDATGAFIAAATTDANGSVLQEVPANSQVTAFFGTAAFPQLVTVTGVQPGDHLTALDATVGNTTAVDFQVPMATPPSGTADYLVYGGNCTQELPFDTTQGEVDLDPSCVGPTGQFSVLAVALGEGGAPLGFAYTKGAQVSADGGAPTVALPSPWATVFGQESVTLTNVPDSLQTYLNLSEFSSGAPNTTYDFDFSTVDGGTSASFGTHPGYSDFVQAEVELQSNTETIGTIRAIATRADAPTAAQPTGGIAIDVSGVLPVISDASVDASNVLRPTVTVTPAAPLAGAAGTFVSASWQDTGDGGALGGTWTLVVPASVTTVQFPALPAGTPLAPTASASWDTTPSVAAIGGGALVSYDALRSTAATIASSLNANATPLVPGLPANGTMNVTLYYENQITETASLLRRTPRSP
jgi:hypothetical protein